MATKLQYGRLKFDFYMKLLNSNTFERIPIDSNTFEYICDYILNCNMQGIYEFSSSDRVRRVEEDLSKELKELQNAIEENDFLKVTSSNSQKSFRYVWSLIY